MQRDGPFFQDYGDNLMGSVAAQPSAPATINTTMPEALDGLISAMAKCKSYFVNHAGDPQKQRLFRVSTSLEKTLLGLRGHYNPESISLQSSEITDKLDTIFHWLDLHPDCKDFCDTIPLRDQLKTALAKAGLTAKSSNEHDCRNISNTLYNAVEESRAGLRKAATAKGASDDQYETISRIVHKASSELSEPLKFMAVGMPHRHAAGIQARLETFDRTIAAYGLSLKNQLRDANECPEFWEWAGKHQDRSVGLPGH